MVVEEEEPQFQVLMEGPVVVVAMSQDQVTFLQLLLLKDLMVELEYIIVQMEVAEVVAVEVLLL